VSTKVEGQSPAVPSTPHGAESRPELVLEQREVGRIVGHAAGPTLVVVAGIHGNEAAGIFAARRVLDRLRKAELPLKGELVVLAGNLAALRMGKRYQVKDLNRQWTEARVASLRAQGGTDVLAVNADAEDNEQRELMGAIDEAIARSRGRVHLADFHTTSAQGIPFVLFGDTIAQRKFVRAFPLPVLVGLEEQLDGALSEYWTRHGCVTFACEGGQHHDPGSVDNLEAVLYLALQTAGIIPVGSLPELAKSYALLRARRGDLPAFLEVVSRHAISEADAFKMEPGFRNLNPASEGQLLAHDVRGEIRAPKDGLVILPLYQGLGSDGFFWGRPVSDVRLRTAEILRRLHVDRLLGLLPGVRKDPKNPSRLIVREVAQKYPRDMFHAFGYRRVRTREGELTIERQPDATR
jgi:predicted deacylase